MTLDEAIKHCDEIAEAHAVLRKRYDDASGYSRSHNEYIRTDDAKKHDKCNQDFIQLAGWLRELKALRAEPCEDAISREDAIMCMTGKYVADLEYKPEDIISQHIKRIKMLPSVAPTRKKGKWIKHDTGHSIYYDCSLCGCTAPHIEVADKILWKLSNYCPDCGAKMEGEA